MKLHLFALTTLLFSTAYAAENPVLLDATCSYMCNYTVERCYDGCWEIESARKKYVDFRGLSLEAIETMPYSKELQQVCLKTLPEMEQWDTNAKFSGIKEFKCQYFKH